MKTLALEAGAADAVLCSHWADGGVGAKKLAEAVHAATNSKSADFKFTYDLDLNIEEKIRMIGQKTLLTFE